MSNIPALPDIIDRARLRRQRGRARFAEAAFLRVRAFGDVVDRLELTQRRFDRALFIGADDVLSRLTPDCAVGDIISMETVRSSGTSPTSPPSPSPLWPRILADADDLPFGDQAFDLIVNFLTLHAARDPVGVLTQARLALKPDGLFIGVAFGEETLRPLREALTAAELAHHAGAARRIYPFASVRDYGSALQRAGFALPVSDLDRVMVEYQNPARLFEDLRNLGERSALAGPRAPLSRQVVFEALASLADTPVNFDLVTMTGWAPHDSQQKPAPRGSATMSLQEALRRGS